MKEMILLLVVGAFTALAIGALLGARFEEINLRVRERRLAEERRRVTAQTRALKAHYEVNNLIYQAQNELRQAALLQAQDLPVDIHLEVEVPYGSQGPGQGRRNLGARHAGGPMTGNPGGPMTLSPTADRSASRGDRR